MTPPLLSTTYFGPVEWYALLARHREVWLEACETFPKQTYRNRCHIASGGGRLSLSVPVEGASSGHTPVKDVRLSDHGNWRRQHWHALQTAYGDSPFFVYYADDLHTFFERQWTHLWDMNLAIIECMCQLLDIHPVIHETTTYEHTPSAYADMRTAIHPKLPLPDTCPMVGPYYQVFAHRKGFMPHLSILDLLCNEGTEGILTLLKPKGK